MVGSANAPAVRTRDRIARPFAMNARDRDRPASAIRSRLGKSRVARSVAQNVTPAMAPRPPKRPKDCKYSSQPANVATPLMTVGTPLVDALKFVPDQSGNVSRPTGRALIANPATIDATKPARPRAFKYRKIGSPSITACARATANTYGTKP